MNICEYYIVRFLSFLFNELLSSKKKKKKKKTSEQDKLKYDFESLDSDEILSNLIYNDYCYMLNFYFTFILLSWCDSNHQLLRK
jgi:hypothetical protein